MQKRELTRLTTDVYQLLTSLITVCKDAVVVQVCTVQLKICFCISTCIPFVDIGEGINLLRIVWV